MNLVVSSDPATGDDVAFVDLIAPKQITVNDSKSLEMDVVASTTVKRDVDATVTLTAAPSAGVRIRIDDVRITKEMKAADGTKKFGFDAKLVCTKDGTWPVVWTAKISANKNSNSVNDTFIATTQVICNIRHKRED